MTVPREFVFMDRAAIGLGGVFLHLRAELNFYRLFNEAIEDFSIDRVAARQSAALAAAGLDRASLAAEGAAVHAAAIAPQLAPVCAVALPRNCANPRACRTDSIWRTRMADHGQVEYATAEGNDLPAHEATYEHFVHLAFVGGAHVASIVIGLAIGGDHGALARMPSASSCVATHRGHPWLRDRGAGCRAWSWW